MEPDGAGMRVCRRPRGFAFVEFASGDRRDAEDAIRGMDGRNFGGRDITVCFSREVRHYGPVQTKH
jgi:RNA recognition motif-containing protein